MRGRPLLRLALGLVTLAGALAAAAVPAGSQTPKRGGILTSMVVEDPPGFSIHESATVSTVWPMMPCYSNLVLFDQLEAHETVDTVVPELAEKWSWQDNHRNLVFFLPHTVVFGLRRPQPSLLLMLAAGCSPVYPAHVSPADLRQRCVGTGPFRLEEYVRGPYVELERNPDYVVSGRPHLDGIRYLIGANLTAPGIDDPDVYLYENFKCGTSRNYTDYGREEIDRLIDLQSQELDRAKRLRLVWEIQRRLEADVARPMLGWRKEYFTQWPQVRNLVPHHSLDNRGRMQEVWLDR